MIERLMALAVLAASGVYLINGLPLPQGTAARPGPGFFPLAVGVFGAAVALVWVVTALRRPRRASASHAEVLDVGPDTEVLDAGADGVWRAGASGRGRVGATAVLLVGYCLLLPWAGYPVTGFLFTGLALRGLGAGWTSAIAIALASAVVSYYVFAVMLGVPLPRGVLLD
jgi:putative tricarboxylic transport membrane protein